MPPTSSEKRRVVYGANHRTGQLGKTVPRGHEKRRSATTPEAEHAFKNKKYVVFKTEESTFVVGLGVTRAPSWSHQSANNNVRRESA